MWQGQYETTTDVRAETLFRVISDINNWNKWDDGLEFTKLEGVAKQGASFLLKPKGGPNVKVTIDEIKPYRLVDTAHLFLAKSAPRMSMSNPVNKRLSALLSRFGGRWGFSGAKLSARTKLKGPLRKQRH